MDNFEDYMNTNELYDKSLSFLNNVINNVNKEIVSLNELQEIIEDKGIVGLYLGKENKNYMRYYDLAIRNYNFDFYMSFDESLKEEILKNYNVTADKDVFLVLRSKENIDHYDKNQAVPFTEFHSEILLKKFFEFERYPKLRDCTWNRQNVEELFFKRHFMMLYISGDEDNSQNRWNFESAVEYLPKRMIYSTC